MKIYKQKNLISENILFVIVSIVFALMIVLGVTFAWFTDSFTKEDDGGTIGEVGIEIYSGDTVINGTKQEDGTYLVGTILQTTMPNTLNTTIPIDIKIKNTGNIPGIVRCLVVATNDEILYDHEENELQGAYSILSTSALKVEQTGWVNLYDHELINDQNYFNSFYNSQLAGGATQNVATGLTGLTEGMQGSKVFVFVRAEIVAYSGNAYQVDTPENPVDAVDKPFGVLTAAFLQQWTAWK